MTIKLGIDVHMDLADKIFKDYIDESIGLSRDSFKNMTLFTFENKDLDPEDFKDRVSRAILEVVLRIYGLENIRKSLDMKNSHLGQEERDLAYSIAQEMLVDEDNLILEREYIQTEIVDYMESYPLIYLDGFVVFRLKNLNDIVESVVDLSIDSLNYNKDYDDFIEVLNYMSDQKSELKRISIVFNGDDYRLYDESSKEIARGYFYEIVEDLDLGPVEDGDILVGALLALSPERISIRLDGPKTEKTAETIGLIEEIFKNRIYYCFSESNCIRKVGNKFD